MTDEEFAQIEGQLWEVKKVLITTVNNLQIENGIKAFVVCKELCWVAGMFASMYAEKGAIDKEVARTLCLKEFSDQLRVVHDNSTAQFIQ